LGEYRLLNRPTPSISEKPVVRVNLRDYDFKKAGHHEADAKALESLFNQIMFILVFSMCFKKNTTESFIYSYIP
jgi:hypothetical protein